MHHRQQPHSLDRREQEFKRRIGRAFMLSEDLWTEAA